MTDWKYIYEKPLEALTNRQIIQKLCHEFSIHPTRQAGQNFLIESQIAQTMADAAVVKESDTVLEIGPGLGALTVVLAKRAKQLVAVEKDPRIFKALFKILEPYKNIKLILGDVLKISLFPLLKNGKEKGHFKLVANLPYSITSAVLRKFTETEPKPELMTVMIQKEVAERVCAKIGEMSLLSVAIQFYAKPEIVKIISREAFWPKPEIESAVIKLKVHKVMRTDVDIKRFFQIIRIGFSSRRKQLQNNLAAGLRLPNSGIQQTLQEAGFNPKIRAQDLSVEDWVKLSESLAHSYCLQ